MILLNTAHIEIVSTSDNGDYYTVHMKTGSQTHVINFDTEKSRDEFTKKLTAGEFVQIG